MTDTPDMAAALFERRQRSLGPVYYHFYRQPLYIVRGEGVWLYDADGRRYLDCYNNVASVGHCHPHVVEALVRQSALLNTHTRYLHHEIVDYAEMLTATLPPDLSVAMLVCTGTEANDLAYRIARAATGNDGAIIIRNTYHGGSTLVSDLSPGDQRRRPCPDFIVEIDAPDTYRGHFAGDGEQGEKYAALVDEAVATLSARGRSPAMLMIDSIFDSPGVFTPPPTYQQRLYETVRAAGGLIVADEVQSGLCRLGDHYWGFQDSDVVPDIVTMGKPMGNGHPLAIVATTPEIAQRFSEKEGYFNTFGGNPVSAAVGKAVLEVVEQDRVLDNVHQTGRHLRSGLCRLMEKHDLIGDVRGKGLYYGVELVTDRSTQQPAGDAAAQVVEHMRQSGVLIARIGRSGNILKLRPPLVFDRDHADQVLDGLESAIASV